MSGDEHPPDPPLEGVRAGRPSPRAGAVWLVAVSGIAAVSYWPLLAGYLGWCVIRSQQTGQYLGCGRDNPIPAIGLSVAFVALVLVPVLYLVNRTLGSRALPGGWRQQTALWVVSLGLVALGPALAVLTS